MSAAAAVWRLARGCALGNLASCSCATPPRREPPSPSALTSSRSFTTKSASFDLITAKNSFKWGGCGDDVKSASRIAKKFLQGSSPTGTGQTGKFLHAINMHNNRAGRRVIFNFYFNIFKVKNSEPQFTVIFSLKRPYKGLSDLKNWKIFFLQYMKPQF